VYPSTVTWIVTGGAGYIGSEIAYQLLAAGKNVFVIDDLSTGAASAVPPGAKFLEIDLRDPNLFASLPQDEKFEGVIHAAGIKYAGESVKHPEEHYSRNVAATLAILSVCRDLSIPRFIFSSSASVYGNPEVSPVTEDAPLQPESPYGRSKLAAEWLVRDFATAHGMSYTCLRFFNVVGVGAAGVADTSPFNLFPNLLRALRNGTEFELFGTDLDTPDGTCIRDYIHVSDIAFGHLAVITSLERGQFLAHAYNLGMGQGISVGEIINEFENALNQVPAIQERPQRPGDTLALWALNELAMKDLDWLPTVTLPEIVESCLQTFIR
jgi:UDP-glucose 4-epimerase